MEVDALKVETRQPAPSAQIVSSKVTNTRVRSEKAQTELKKEKRDAGTSIQNRVT